MPALPGETITSPTDGDKRSRSARACSLPPDPTTTTPDPVLRVTTPDRYHGAVRRRSIRKNVAHEPSDFVMPELYLEVESATKTGTANMEQLPDLHIQRPYGSLEDYLEGDFWTVERKDMFLIGAPSFDVGVAVKFTIELADGTPAVTGEGRVVEYTAPSDDFPGGLKVRFRQLDAEAKAVLKRALEVRRRAYAAALEAAPPEAPPVEAPPAEAALPAAPLPAETAPAAALAAEPAPPPVVLPPEPARAVVAASQPTRMPSVRAPSLSTPPAKPRTGMRHRSPGIVSAPPNRDALLGRLRDRARNFSGGRAAAK
jgi:hypothetical protein